MVYSLHVHGALVELSVVYRGLAGCPGLSLEQRLLNVRNGLCCAFRLSSGGRVDAAALAAVCRGSAGWLRSFDSSVCTATHASSFTATGSVFVLVINVRVAATATTEAKRHVTVVAVLVEEAREQPAAGGGLAVRERQLRRYHDLLQLGKLGRDLLDILRQRSALALGFNFLGLGRLRKALGLVGVLLQFLAVGQSHALS